MFIYYTIGVDLMLFSAHVSYLETVYILMKCKVDVHSLQRMNPNESVDVFLHVPSPQLKLNSLKKEIKLIRNPNIWMRTGGKIHVTSVTVQIYKVHFEDSAHIFN